MSAPRTPNYRTRSDYTYSAGRYDTKTLPGGSYVRPIYIGYVPKHVTEDPRWKDVSSLSHTYCYTKHGMIPISNDCLEET